MNDPLFHKLLLFLVGTFLIYYCIHCIWNIFFLSSSPDEPHYDSRSVASSHLLSLGPLPRATAHPICRWSRSRLECQWPTLLYLKNGHWSTRVCAPTPYHQSPFRCFLPIGRGECSRIARRGLRTTHVSTLLVWRAGRWQLLLSWFIRSVQSVKECPWC